MTIRNEYNHNLMMVGKIIQNHRKNLNVSKSREGFLSDRIEKGILTDRTFSLETLKNIENGKTLPSLSTLKLLSYALEVDFIELVEELSEYL